MKLINNMFRENQKISHLLDLYFFVFEYYNICFTFPNGVALRFAINAFVFDFKLDAHVFLIFCNYAPMCFQSTLLKIIVHVYVCVHAFNRYIVNVNSAFLQYFTELLQSNNCAHDFTGLCVTIAFFDNLFSFFFVFPVFLFFKYGPEVHINVNIR